MNSNLFDNIIFKNECISDTETLVSEPQNKFEDSSPKDGQSPKNSSSPESIETITRFMRRQSLLDTIDSIDNFPIDAKKCNEAEKVKNSVNMPNAIIEEPCIQPDRSEEMGDTASCEEDKATLSDNTSTNDKEVVDMQQVGYKICDGKLRIGIVDFGEKDYLIKCIHEGTAPVSRFGQFSYLLIPFRSDYSVFDHRIDIIKSAPETKSNDQPDDIDVNLPFDSKLVADVEDPPQQELCLKSSDTEKQEDNCMKSDRCEDFVLEAVPVTEKDNSIYSSLGTVNWNMNRKDMVMNETIFNISALPLEVEYIAVFVDRSIYTEKDLYYMYFIDSTEKIYESFFMPEYLRSCKNSNYTTSDNSGGGPASAHTDTDPSKFQFICIFKRSNEDAQTWEYIKEQKNITAEDKSETV